MPSQGRPDRGNEIVKARMEPWLVKLIDDTCERLKRTGRGKPPNRSELLRRAVIELMAKFYRSAAWRRRKKQLARAKRIGLTVVRTRSPRSHAA